MIHRFGSGAPLLDLILVSASLALVMAVSFG